MVDLNSTMETLEKYTYLLENINKPNDKEKFTKKPLHLITLEDIIPDEPEEIAELPNDILYQEKLNDIMSQLMKYKQQIV